MQSQSYNSVVVIVVLPERSKETNVYFMKPGKRKTLHIHSPGTKIDNTLTVNCFYMFSVVVIPPLHYNDMRTEVH